MQPSANLTVDESSLASRLLRQEVVVSLGCTEPAAIALAAAAAAAALDGPVERLRVRTDLGTYKNALSVGLPGTGGRGPALAAAAGALVADPSPGLRIFETVTGDHWRRAAAWAADGRVEVEPRSGMRGVMIDVEAQAAGHRGVARIAGRHDQIVSTARDGVALTSTEDREHATAIGDDAIRLALANPVTLLRHHAMLDASDLEFVGQGLALNRALAEASLAQGLGLGYGRALRHLASCHDVGIEVERWVAAGVEARMAGVSAPVVTSGGSGNAGLTVTLGVWAAARKLQVRGRDRVLGAIALAHLVNIAVKARIGRVGPLCGGTAASALGVGCAVAWLLGGNADTLDLVIRHHVATLAGVVCDGAKPACALKIGAGVRSAVQAAQLAVTGDLDPGVDGLGGACAATAFEHLELLAVAGYPETDRTLATMLHVGRLRDGSARVIRCGCVSADPQRAHPPTRRGGQSAARTQGEAAPFCTDL